LHWIEVCNPFFRYKICLMVTLEMKLIN
jgi:hypothetical protein